MGEINRVVRMIGEPRRGSARRPTMAVVVLAASTALAVAATGCRHIGRGPGAAVVPELYESERYPLENIDSLAVWPDGGWLIGTAKSTDRLLVFDTRQGALVHGFGTRGEGPGEFRRPNGVAVVGDLLLVVERDNRRVQVLRLPTLEPLGSFGRDVLRYPYGVAAFAGDDGEIELYVTDSYLDERGTVPPAAALGKRVKQFRVEVQSSGVRGELVRSFGDVAGPGVLWVVESIAADVPHGRLLIADEDPRAHDIKVYTLDGRFTGRVLGSGLFAAEPEGIALLTCGSEGWWVTADQRKSRTVFHVFERTSLSYLGAFAGRRVANTDGIAAAGVGCRVAPEGAVFAVDDDAAVAAFSWPRIATAVHVQAQGCATGGRLVPTAR